MRYEIKLSSGDIGDINVHMRGPEYLDCLHDIVTMVRAKAKYGETPETTWNEVYDQLLAILNEYRIDPFEE